MWRKNPTSATSDIYRYKMALFENGQLDEFLLFVQYLQNTIDTIRVKLAAENIQYMRKLLCEKGLCEFETPSGTTSFTTNVNQNQIILGLGTYLFPINALYKKTSVRCQNMINTCALKVRNYSAHMVELDEYLSVFIGSGGTQRNYFRQYSQWMG